MDSPLPALFNQGGRICSVFGRKYIFCSLGGPTLVSLGDDQETCNNYGFNSLKTLSTLVVYEGGKPLPIGELREGAFVRFDAITLKHIGYFAIAVWVADSKPHIIPYPTDGSYVLCKVLENAPVLQFDLDSKTLTFTDDNDVSRNALIDLDEDILTYIKVFLGVKTSDWMENNGMLKGTIDIFCQSDASKPLSCICTFLKITKSLSYTPNIHFEATKVYNLSGSMMTESLKGKFLHADIDGEIIHKENNHFLRFTFHSKKFELPFNYCSYSYQTQSVCLHILESALRDGCSNFIIIMIVLKAKNLAFSVDLPFTEHAIYVPDSSPSKDVPLKEETAENFEEVDPLFIFFFYSTMLTLFEYLKDCNTSLNKLDEIDSRKIYNHRSNLISNKDFYLQNSNEASANFCVDCHEAKNDNHSKFHHDLPFTGLESTETLTFSSKHSPLKQNMQRDHESDQSSKPLVPDFIGSVEQNVTREEMQNSNDFEMNKSSLVSEVANSFIGLPTEVILIKEQKNKTEEESEIDCIVSKHAVEKEEDGQVEIDVPGSGKRLEQTDTLDKAIDAFKAKILPSAPEKKIVSTSGGVSTNSVNEVSTSSESGKSKVEKKHIKSSNCSAPKDEIDFMKDSLQIVNHISKNGGLDWITLPFLLRNWTGKVHWKKEEIFIIFNINFVKHNVKLINGCIILIDDKIVKPIMLSQGQTIQFDACRQENSFEILLAWVGQKPKTTVDPQMDKCCLLDMFGYISQVVSKNCIKINCRYPYKSEIDCVKANKIFNGAKLVKLNAQFVGAPVLVQLLNHSSLKDVYMISFLIHLNRAVQKVLFPNLFLNNKVSLMDTNKDHLPTVPEVANTPIGSSTHASLTKKKKRKKKKSNLSVSSVDKGKAAQEEIDVPCCNKSLGQNATLTEPTNPSEVKNLVVVPKKKIASNSGGVSTSVDKVFTSSESIECQVKKVHIESSNCLSTKVDSTFNDSLQIVNHLRRTNNLLQMVSFPTLLRNWTGIIQREKQKIFLIFNVGMVKKKVKLSHGSVILNGNQIVKPKALQREQTIKFDAHCQNNSFKIFLAWFGKKPQAVFDPKTNEFCLVDIFGFISEVISKDCIKIDCRYPFVEHIYCVKANKIFNGVELVKLDSQFVGAPVLAHLLSNSTLNDSCMISFMIHLNTPVQKILFPKLYLSQTSNSNIKGDHLSTVPKVANSLNGSSTQPIITMKQKNKIEKESGIDLSDSNYFDEKGKDGQVKIDVPGGSRSLEQNDDLDKAIDTFKAKTFPSVPEKKFASTSGGVSTNSMNEEVSTSSESGKSKVEKKHIKSSNCSSTKEESAFMKDSLQIVNHFRKTNYLHQMVSFPSLLRNWTGDIHVEEEKIFVIFSVSLVKQNVQLTNDSIVLIEGKIVKPNILQQGQMIKFDAYHENNSFEIFLIWIGQKPKAVVDPKTNKCCLVDLFGFISEVVSKNCIKINCRYPFELEIDCVKANKIFNGNELVKLDPQFVGAPVLVHLLTNSVLKDRYIVSFMIHLNVTVQKVLFPIPFLDNQISGLNSIEDDLPYHYLPPSDDNDGKFFILYGKAKWLSSETLLFEGKYKENFLSLIIPFRIILPIDPQPKEKLKDLRECTSCIVNKLKVTNEKKYLVPVVGWTFYEEHECILFPDSSYGSNAQGSSVMLMKDSLQFVTNLCSNLAVIDGCIVNLPKSNGNLHFLLAKFLSGNSITYKVILSTSSFALAKIVMKAFSPKEVTPDRNSDSVSQEISTSKPLLKGTLMDITRDDAFLVKDNSLIVLVKAVHIFLFGISLVDIDLSLVLNEGESVLYKYHSSQVKVLVEEDLDLSPSEVYESLSGWINHRSISKELASTLLLRTAHTPGNLAPMKPIADKKDIIDLECVKFEEQSKNESSSDATQDAKVSFIETRETMSDQYEREHQELLLDELNAGSQKASGTEFQTAQQPNEKNPDLKSADELRDGKEAIHSSTLNEETLNKNDEMLNLIKTHLSDNRDSLTKRIYLPNLLRNWSGKIQKDRALDDYSLKFNVNFENLSIKLNEKKLTELTPLLSPERGEYEQEVFFDAYLNAEGLYRLLLFWNDQRPSLESPQLFFYKSYDVIGFVSQKIKVKSGYKIFLQCGYPYSKTISCLCPSFIFYENGRITKSNLTLGSLVLMQIKDYGTHFISYNMIYLSEDILKLLFPTLFFKREDLLYEIPQNYGFSIVEGNLPNCEFHAFHGKINCFTNEVLRLQIKKDRESVHVLAPTNLFSLNASDTVTGMMNSKDSLACLITKLEILPSSKQHFTPIVCLLSTSYESCFLLCGSSHTMGSGAHPPIMIMDASPVYSYAFHGILHTKVAVIDGKIVQLTQDLKNLIYLVGYEAGVLQPRIILVCNSLLLAKVALRALPLKREYMDDLMQTKYRRVGTLTNIGRDEAFLKIEGSRIIFTKEVHYQSLTTLGAINYDLRKLFNEEQEAVYSLDRGFLLMGKGIHLIPSLTCKRLDEFLQERKTREDEVNGAFQLNCM